MFRPCLYRHEVNSTYYGIKELKGKEKDHFALNLMALIEKTLSGGQSGADTANTSPEKRLAPG
jgi:hypothetical protein